MAPGALGQIPECDAADGDADEAQDLDVEGFKEAADVAVAALVEDQFEPGVFFAGAEEGGALGGEEAFGGWHAVLQGGQQGVIGQLVDLDVVGFVEMAGWVGDGTGPGGVVGEEEEALAGLVEAADGSEVGVGNAVEAGEDVGAAFFVRGGGDETPGFVEHQEDGGSDRDEPAIDEDDLAFKTDGELGVAADDAVHLDATGAGEGGGGAAGAKAEFGEDAGEAGHGGSERRNGAAGKCRLAQSSRYGTLWAGFAISRLPVLGPMFMTDLECPPVTGGFESRSARAWPGTKVGR